MNKANTQFSDISRENELGKTKNLHFTVILRATQHREGIENNNRNLGRIP